MNAKLLKIIDDLGWTHEEQGKVSIWFDKEFNLDAIQNEIQTFKELFEKDIEGYTLRIGNVTWDDESYSYILDYELVDNKARELREAISDLKHHYENNNLVNEYENKTFGNFTLEINIYKELNLTFADNITELVQENILQEDFVVAVLNEDKERVEQIFEEAYQRLK
jgi:hypothetical protein